MYFHDRKDAGQQLGQKLAPYKDQKNTLVLALPRGGVPVAFEVAQALNLPLDLMLVRKLGVPGNEELAMGAIASGNVRVLNKDIVRGLSIPESVLERITATEQAELQRRSAAYHQGKQPPVLKGKTVILVDDGCATGANMNAAVRAAAAQQAEHIIVAVPVASDEAYKTLRKLADEVVCLDVPEPFYGVGRFYQDFSQTTDQDVMNLLQEADAPRAENAA